MRHTGDAQGIGATAVGPYRRTSFRVLYAATCITSLSLASAAIAEVTVEGEVGPSDPANWNSSTSLSIGMGNSGAVGVSEGAAVSTSSLYVGFDGAGSLSISSGGSVHSFLSYLGYTNGAVGSVTVTGSGSTWIDDLWIRVGGHGPYIGTGTLTVDNGGSVLAKSLFAAANDLRGNGTITTKGLVSDVDLVFDAAHGLQQTLGFGTGGTLNLDLRGGADFLGLGHAGQGTLRIADGMSVSTTTKGYLGYQSGSSGSATVTGAGSTWNANSLTVGDYGNGSLEISNGGKVIGSGTVGANPGSSGVVTVTGAGSSWTANGLEVGPVGSGTLKVLNGATVTTQSLSAAAQDLQGNGTINTQGLVSDLDLTFDATHGVMQTFSFGDGGTLNLNVTGKGSLGVGHSSQATLYIADGVSITSSSGAIGLKAGSSGRAVITGVGSRWQTGPLYVGRNGSGTLEIRDGATLNAGTTYITFNGGARGAVNLADTGSIWSTSGVNMGASATVNIADGLLTTGSFSIGHSSSLNLRVVRDGMVALNSSSAIFRNDGRVNLYADPFLAAGTYRPIKSGSPPTSWTGSGTYEGFGGLWNNTDKTFTVAQSIAAASGEGRVVEAYQRLLITSPDGLSRMGASFGALPAATIFTATAMTPELYGDLPLSDGHEVLAAWDFDSTLADEEVFLSFDIGPGASLLQAWHFSGGKWSTYSPDDLIYSDNIAAFSADRFSPYALTGMVPEPATVGLAMAPCCVLLSRRRRQQ